MSNLVNPSSKIHMLCVFVFAIVNCFSFKIAVRSQTLNFDTYISIIKSHFPN